MQSKRSKGLSDCNRIENVHRRANRFGLVEHDLSRISGVGSCLASTGVKRGGIVRTS